VWVGACRPVVKAVHEVASRTSALPIDAADKDVSVPLRLFFVVFFIVIVFRAVDV
jgi:hypothetical protein